MGLRKLKREANYYLRLQRLWCGSRELKKKKIRKGDDREVTEGCLDYILTKIKHL